MATPQEYSKLSGTVQLLVGAFADGATLVPDGTLELLPGDEHNRYFANLMLNIIQLDRFNRLSRVQLSLTEGLLIALEDHNKRLSMSAGQVVFSTTTRIRQLDTKLAPWVKFETQLAWLQRLVVAWRFQKLARINVTGIPGEGRIGLAVIPREITASLRETNYQYRLWERTPDARSAIAPPPAEHSPLYIRRPSGVS